MQFHFTIEGINTSNFLKEGAFVRWKGIWYIFEGPFAPVRAPDSEVFSIYCQDFYGSRASVLKATASAQVKSPFWNCLKVVYPALNRFWGDPARENYSSSFKQILSQIQMGNWNKAVPIAFSSAVGSPSAEEKIQILAQMAQAPDSLIPYGFWRNEEGVMGLTPEILFWQKGSVMESMALAGTEKKTVNPSQFLEDHKTLNEHRFVADELTQKLQGFGTVRKGEPQILELPTLRHVLTRFEVNLDPSFSSLEALRKLHPTSALGVSPHSRWKELQQLPDQKGRNYFGAPLLFNLNSNESLALVALRQIQWREGRIFIGAGGGVVKESQEELEWQEILAKMDSVKKTLGIQ